MKQLIVASTNAGKIREVSLALQALADWSVQALPVGLPEIDETGSTFVENAGMKAIHYSRFFDGLALADDSGLSVHALNGRPGVHTARYASSAEALNIKLLGELSDLNKAGNTDRHATFYCALAVAREGHLVWRVESELEGMIAWEPKGSLGFGYDPIFFIPGLGKTLAELTTERKNQISARGQALEELRRFLTTI